MKRTITIRVDVADDNEYADAVENVLKVPGVITAAWTQGEQIQPILLARGHDPKYLSGSTAQIIREYS